MILVGPGEPKETRRSLRAKAPRAEDRFPRLGSRRRFGRNDCMWRDRRRRHRSNLRRLRDVEESVPRRRVQFPRIRRRRSRSLRLPRKEGPVVGRTPQEVVSFRCKGAFADGALDGFADLGEGMLEWQPSLWRFASTRHRRRKSTLGSPERGSEGDRIPPEQRREPRPDQSAGRRGLRIGIGGAFRGTRHTPRRTLQGPHRRTPLIR